MIALEAQQSDPVRHNPDRQPGQPRHPSPHSVSILAAIHTFINEMADLCEKVGADVHDVARGIGLDGSIGRKFLHPGPGFGGSCFPKDTLACVRLYPHELIVGKKPAVYVRMTDRC